MEKIGILTFHYSNNYGGVLQTAALQKVIEGMGYDAEIINFIPTSYAPINKIHYVELLKRIVRRKLKKAEVIPTVKKIMFVKSHSKNMLKKFDFFRTEEMKLTRRVDESSLESILEEYRIVIVGSDQVWNPSQRGV